jgi:hypothetical protein
MNNDLSGFRVLKIVIRFFLIKSNEIQLVISSPPINNVLIFNALYLFYHKVIPLDISFGVSNGTRFVV